MERLGLFSDINTNIIQMSSEKEVANSTVTKGKADDSMSVKSVGKKSLKKTIKEKKLKNVNEQKRDDAYSETENNKNFEQNKNHSHGSRKRKADVVEESESNIEQEAEDNTSGKVTNATKSGESENISEKIPKIKSARRDNAEKVTEQKIGDDSNNEKKKAGDRENKKASSTNLPGKGHPPISEMVLDSIRALRKRNGASTDEISKYVEDNFQVNINRIKPHIKKFLQKGVTDGLFDQVSGSGGDGKFKIIKTGKVTKESQKSKRVKANERRTKVTKAVPRNKKESLKVSRKFKNDKVRPKKRMGV